MKKTRLILINLSVLMPTHLRQKSGKKSFRVTNGKTCEMMVKVRDREDRTGMIMFGFLSPVN